MKKTVFIGFIAALCCMMFASCEKKDETTDGTGNSVNLSRDLAALYTFDNGTCNDASGRGCHGAANGSVTYVNDTPSKQGKAVAIDGTSRQFINIPYDLIGDSINFSFSIWLKDFGTGRIVYSVGCAPGFYVNADCTPVINGSRDEINFSYNLEKYQAAGWHMFTVTASRTTHKLKLYIDGGLVDAKEAYPGQYNHTKTQIGGNGDGRFDAWADPMIVDNFRVYRRCLNDKEVRELYNLER